MRGCALLAVALCGCFLSNVTREEEDSCAANTEVCDLEDQDCDGRVDEDSCGPTAECRGGQCYCRPENLCGACVDYGTDARDCPQCVLECAEFESVCARNRCCELAPDHVDVLVVMDNSNDFAEEQSNFSAQLPRIVQVLLEGDLDSDEREDFPPLGSIRWGVVTTDMGTGGQRIPACRDSDIGDDGVLRTQGNTAISGCSESYPRFLEFEPGDEPRIAAQDLTCLVNMGTNGCGIEQPLEAMLKALVPSSSPYRFATGSTGHGDGVNAGFLRDNAQLLVLMLTDEDDCSIADPELLNPSSATYEGDLNLRCTQYPGALHPVSRYVEGLLSLKPDPWMIHFAAIVGIPERLAAVTDYEQILADPDMQIEVDPAMPTRIRPSCNRPGAGLSFPPRRIVEVAQGLESMGAGTVVQSVCVDDSTGVLSPLIDKIGYRVDSSCVE